MVIILLEYYRIELNLYNFQFNDVDTNNNNIANKGKVICKSVIYVGCLVFYLWEFYTAEWDILLCSF